MKKLFTLLFATALMASSANAQVTTNVTVEKKADLQTALSDAAALSPGDIANIFIKGDINLGSFTFSATTRNIHFIGINDEETGAQAILRTELVFPSNESEADKFALTFENLHLMDNNGEWSSSKHFINFKDANKHFVDSFVVKNCEISNICRSFLRGQINEAPTDGTYTGCGTFNYFEMSDCVFHNGSRQDNAMPLIYMAWSTNTMIFRNNTFYDLPYLNSLVTFAYMTDDTGRQPVKFFFENNTICAWAKSTLLNFGTYVTSDSEFHLKNNILLFPNWSDDCNNRIGDTQTKHDMGEEAVERDGGVTTFGYLTEEEIAARIGKGTTLTNILGGLVQMENNLLSGYKYQNFAHTKVGEEYFNYIESGDIIPIGDTEEESFDDFAPALTMEDVPFAWTDFTDAQNDMFQINFAAAAYTAGKNGAPLGDTNNYTSQVIEKVSLTVSVEGSETVSFTIDPVKEQYFSGDKVTITLFDHNNALRTINKFLGWSDGSDETVRSIELTSDLNLVAKYEAAIPNIVSWFDFATTPAAGQNKLPSYEADVYAEGNQAVATMYFVPSITDEEGNATGLEEAYKQADGSENRFNWRGNKFGEDAVEQQIGVLSRKTSQLSQQAGKPDYFVFTFSTTGLKNVEFSAFCGTDNFGYKTQLADYSLDGGATWTNFAKVDLESRDAEYSIGAGKLWGWTELKGILPAAAEGKESVMVRVIGDTKGEKVDNVISEIDQETANMFEYTGSVLIRHSVEGGQEERKEGDVTGDGVVDVADITQVIAIMAADIYTEAADVNGDGKVDVADITQIISIMARSN